jgi:sugar lactone lactonase YvrE
MKEAIPFSDINTSLGEGPVWDPVLQQIYWVDINAGRYFKANFPSGETQEFNINQHLGALALREKGGLVMATRDGFGFFDEKTKELTLLDHSPEKNNALVRFNDGAVDPMGRFFAGTMEIAEERNIGKLFRLDTDYNIALLEENIYISNGMDWSLDHKHFFYIDTLAHCVYVYDYDLETGNISNRRNYIEFSKDEFPDGMTIDSEGGFWIAFWGASKIGHYDAAGKKIEEIYVPAPQPTSCCFGGPDMKTLFITSASRDLSAQQMKQTPHAGKLFILETNTLGRGAPRFKG